MLLSSNLFSLSFSLKNQWTLGEPKLTTKRRIFMQIHIYTYDTHCVHFWTSTFLIKMDKNPQIDNTYLWPTRGWEKRLVCRGWPLQNLLLTSLTLILALAEVSMNAQLNCRARLTPWSLPTTLSSSKSHLLPTSTIGTSSVSFTRRICSLRSCRSLNVDCAVIEYTNTNPWPFFM